MIDDCDMGWRMMTVLLATIGGFVWLITHASDCSNEMQRQEHERQLECIRQHIYCGNRQ